MKSSASLLAFALAALPAWAQDKGAGVLSPDTHQHSFGDAEKWSHVFDDPKRDEWQMPHEVIGALKLKPEAAVADVGAGTGYFSTRLANMLKKGRVYAVDIEPDMVKHLAERAKREKLANMVAVTGTPGDPRLPGKVDLVLLVDVYHHVEEREQYFRKLGGALKPGGRIAIIDFRLDSPEGPPKEARMDLVWTLTQTLNGAACYLGRMSTRVFSRNAIRTSLVPMRRNQRTSR